MKRPMKNVLFYCIVLILFSSFIYNNSNSFSELVKNRLTSYTNDYWPEKIYVHTDKPYYTLEENIWFTAYLVNGISHKHSSKSNVVYVELINEADSIVSKKRYYIEHISVAGQFKINKIWTPGKYRIRAYTNYMRNTGPEFFFQKKIHIISLAEANKVTELQNSSDSEKATLDLEKPNLEFFPEGGYLVENIISKVAIKIKDSKYYNYKLPIEIVDSGGTVISQLTSVEFGLGVFYINPKTDENYFANLKLNGKTYQYALPKALSQGYGVNINLRTDELLIRLHSTKNKGLKQSFLMIHQRGKPLFDKVFSTSEKSDIISIYTGNLQNGVTHITLFNDQGQPVCERLVFIDNPKNKVSVSVKRNKLDFKTREKVSLDLQIKNSEGHALSGNLSISVRDLEGIPHREYASNIKTWLLLNSDLRGKIDNPGYFFSDGDDVKKTFLLDLVMLTNGWRRFTWQSILQENINAFVFDVEKGITISGTTKMLTPPHKEVNTINTITFLGAQTLEMYSVTSDTDGRFSFGPYVFYDSIPALIESKLIVPGNNAKTNYKDVLIALDDKVIESPEIQRSKFSPSSSNTMVLNDTFLEAAAEVRDLNQIYDEDRQRLDEVVLTATLKTKEEEREQEMDERSYFGAPSRRLDIQSDQFLSNTPMKYILQRFPGIRLDERYVYYRGEISRILFNNMEVDLDFINSLNSTDISFIDFYDPNNSVYSRAAGGVFTIYGKLGSDRVTKNTSRQPGIINFTSKGFDRSKEFYAPDYSKELDQLTRTDIRTTLHWEPKVRFTSQDLSQEVSFYTCDSKGTYLIEIEGLTDSGIPIQEIGYFSVN
jgi:hypothetical protein